MASKPIPRELSIYINDKQVINSLAGITREIGKTNGQLKHLNKNSETYDQDVKKLTKHLDDLKQVQSGFKDEIYGTQKAMESITWPVAGALLLTDALESGVTKIKEFVDNSVQLAIEAKGVEFAFKQIAGSEQILERVRTATRGLISDLDIKKATNSFKNFNLDLEQLPGLLEFVSVRVSQTGASFDNLLQSMVEGLSKESKLRIDNLGISAMELNAQLEKTPNFIEAVAIIAKKEVAEAGSILDDASNSTTKWNATLANVQLRIGNLINGSGAIDWFRNLGVAILDTIFPTEKASEATEKERLELFMLESKIKDVNTKAEDRIKIIKTLKEKYPQLLADIDAEKVTNEQLTLALKNVNNQLINKIILQTKDDAIEKQNQKTAEKKIELFNQEDKVRRELGRLASKYGIAIKENATLEEQAIDLINKRREKQMTVGGRLVDQTTEFSHQLHNLQVLQGQVNSEETTANKLLNEKNELFKKLNVSQDVMGTTVTTKTNEALAKQKQTLADINAKIEEKKALLEGSSNRDEAKVIQDEIAALEKQKVAILGDEKGGAEAKKLADDKKKIFEEIEKQLTEFIEKAREQRLINQQTGFAKEQAQITAKYEEQITKAAGHTERIKELEALRDQELADAKIKRDAEIATQIQTAKDELEILKAETDEEKEILKAEQDFEKHVLALEKLQLDKEEETALLALLEESQGLKLDEIRKKFREKQAASDKKTLEDKKKLNEEILNGAIGLAGAETRVGQALIAVKGIMAAKETLIQLGVLQTKTAVTAAGAAADIAGGTAATAKVGFPQNIPLLIAFAAQVAGILSAIKNAAKPKVSAPKFYHGGDTGNSPALGYDEYGAVTGVVHKNEYIIPEAMTQNPRYANTIAWLEQERSGLKKYFNGGGSSADAVPSLSGAAADNSLLTSILFNLNATLANGIKAQTIIGYQEAEGIDTLNKERQQSIANGTLNS